MMSLVLRLFCLAVLAWSLPGCESPVAYKITLKDGREYLSNGKPDYHAKTGYYRYRSFQNREALLRADEVLLIEEQGS